MVVVVKVGIEPLTNREALDRVMATLRPGLVRLNYTQPHYV